VEREMAMSDTSARPRLNLKLILAIGLVVLLAYNFWTGSRYPSLDEKAMMSGAITLEDPLSFEAVIPVHPDMPFLQRWIYSAVNWIDTNKKGMTFGLLMGAAFLTLLGYMRRRSFSGPFANSLYGLFLGAPLGVCVNCAAPIAKGLYQGGSRAETTLSAMIASPTLNIVVLTMAFSLLPFYIAIAKITLSLLIILIGVPILCRFIPQDKLLHSVDTVEQAPVSPAAEDSLMPEPDATSLLGEARGFVMDYGRNLWFILRTTVPLMLLAGVLGSLVANMIPPDALSGADANPFAIIAAAILGTFVPVPIGFDVVMSGALLNGGVSHGFVMTLVFTLGSFSIYSFMVVASSVGWRAAGGLAAMVMVLGAIAGMGANAWHGYQTQRALDYLTNPTATETTLNVPRDAPVQLAWAQDAPGESGLVVTAAPFDDASPAGETLYTRMEAWTVGIDHPVEFSFGDMWPPFWEGRSVASGDFDGDGDVDLVFASTREGLYLYANDGSGQFQRVEADLGRVADMAVFNAVLVDLDNSGWPDLFLTTYLDGLFVVPNREGVFEFSAIRPVANRENAVLALSASFGDVDRDGWVDVALGNWAAGWYRRVPGEESRNRIVFNDGGRLSGSRYEDLPGIPGETLSILLTDLDGNGWQDLLVGNDFEVPDYFYFNDGQGGLQAVTHQDGRIPMTTTTTMSLTANDLDNDGALDIYAAQIAGRASGISNRLRMQPIEDYCDGIERDSDRATCQQNIDVKEWYRSGNSLDPSLARRCGELTGAMADECRGMMIKDLAIQNNDPQICSLIPVTQPRVRAFCDIHFWPSRRMTHDEQDAAVQQILARNVLLQPDGEGGYHETAEEQGVEVGGWSWDVTVADFDLDGWQDIYIVNGTWVPNEVTPSNIYLHNRGDGSFEELTREAGLEDFLMTAAATSVDFDNDGDLDLVTVPVNGPVAYFRNNSQGARAVSIRLVDTLGNRDAIGARIVLRTSAGEQMRAIQLGGGFMSFDAPVAHFGLGTDDVITGAVIHWPDGEATEIDAPLEAGNTYTIRRVRRTATGEL